MVHLELLKKIGVKIQDRYVHCTIRNLPKETQGIPNIFFKSSVVSSGVARVWTVVSVGLCWSKFVQEMHII